MGWFTSSADYLLSKICFMDCDLSKHVTRHEGETGREGTRGEREREEGRKMEREGR
jgi:hypothetical protein